MSGNMPQELSRIEVRLVRRHEHDELRRVRLSALAYAPHLKQHLAEESAAPPYFWRNPAELAASATTMATFVAVEGTAFVGVVDGFLAEDGGTVEIGGMWVNPDKRRAGLGRQLLAAICEWAQGRGASRAGLWVREDNLAATLLYERDGFERTKSSRSETGIGFRLEKTL